VASARGLAVYNHNVETVPRLYPRVRHRARYERSLGVLQTVAREFPHLKVKTGVMVGLGETRAELFALMEDLRAHGVHILTIGQYLRPSLKHMPVAEYVTEEGYDDYRARGLLVGFEHVYAGPFVRSSYNAAEALRHAQEAAPPAPLTDSPPPRP
jgi:lipoic acid synthetase